MNERSLAVEITRCENAGEHVAALASGTVVDVGCYGWRLASALPAGVSLVGVDRAEPPHRPAHARFAPIKDGRIDIADDMADLVVATHVIEHIVDVVSFTAELMRIVRPGGRVFIEAPSERSLQKESGIDVEQHRFENFFDDPTHIRPYTPAALYRLALSVCAVPVKIVRVDVDGMPCVRLLCRKPASVTGDVRPRYVTLQNIPAGLSAAWRSIWPDVSM